MSDPIDIAKAKTLDLIYSDSPIFSYENIWKNIKDIANHIDNVKVNAKNIKKYKKF